jgi:hypothetical protein
LKFETDIGVLELGQVRRDYSFVFELLDIDLALKEGMLQDLFAPVAAQSLAPVLHEQAHDQVFSNIADREAMSLLIGPARLFVPY